MRVLRPSGLLVVDNTLSHAKELVEFSELVYADRAGHVDAGDGRRGRAADRQVALNVTCARRRPEQAAALWVASELLAGALLHAAGGDLQVLERGRATRAAAW